MLKNAADPSPVSASRASANAIPPVVAADTTQHTPPTRVAGASDLMLL